MDRRLDQQARACLAALARRGEDARYDSLDRLVEVGIVEDDVGRLSAKLQRHRLHVSRRQLVDLPAGFGAAGEADVRHLGMGHERLADLAAVARDDVDHTVGEARLLEQGREFHHRGRREFRGLHHGGAPGRQRGRELPARERERRVPGRDDGDHALGFVARVGEHALLVARDDIAVHLVREPREVAKVVGHVAHLRNDLAGELAVVALLDGGKAARIADDQVAQSPHQATALRSRHGRPGTGLEGSVGGVHRSIGVRGVSARDMSPGLSGERLVGREVFAGCGFDGLAGDVVGVSGEVGECIHDLAPGRRLIRHYSIQHNAVPFAKPYGVRTDAACPIRGAESSMWTR